MGKLEELFKQKQALSKFPGKKMQKKFLENFFKSDVSCPTGKSYMVTKYLSDFSRLSSMRFQQE